jgi:prepilin-type N-terminal cleavage/methylation domain-containing protein
MTPRTSREPRAQAGFTLIELMVAMALFVFVTLQLVMAFNAQQRSFVNTDNAFDVQEDARLVLDLVSFDTKLAGFMVPDNVAISSVDGGPNAADTLCVSDAGSIQAATYPKPPGQSFLLDSAAGEYAGATVTVAGGLGITVSSLDIDGDGQSDFAANAGVIVATADRAICAQITAISVPTSQLTVNAIPNPPGTVALLGATAVPAVIYQINANTLTRNGLVLAPQIEDLQVEFWVDQDGDRIMDPAEFPIQSLNLGAGAAVEPVRSVRLSVVAMSGTPDTAEGGAPFQKYARPAVANRLAANARDAFKRRVFQASVYPRNVSIGPPDFFR